MYSRLTFRQNTTNSNNRDSPLFAPALLCSLPPPPSVAVALAPSVTSVYAALLLLATLPLLPPPRPRTPTPTRPRSTWPLTAVAFGGELASTSDERLYFVGGALAGPLPPYPALLVHQEHVQRQAVDDPQSVAYL